MQPDGSDPVQYPKRNTIVMKNSSIKKYAFSYLKNNVVREITQCIFLH